MQESGRAARSMVDWCEWVRICVGWAGRPPYQLAYFGRVPVRRVGPAALSSTTHLALPCGISTEDMRASSQTHTHTHSDPLPPREGFHPTKHRSSLSAPSNAAYPLLVADKQGQREDPQTCRGASRARFSVLRLMEQRNEPG